MGRSDASTLARTGGGTEAASENLAIPSIVEAERIDALLQPLHRTLFSESNPIPVKWAVQQMGLIGPGIRLPLTPLAPQFYGVVRDAMTAASVQVAAA